MAYGRTCESLAMLVGSNPLPNYLAAVVLKPSRSILLYSPETVKPRELLGDALRQRGIRVFERCIEDATDARQIRRACQSLDADHLHYSGGTKPMAAHARSASQLLEHQASYLDERRGLLRFDDGFDIELATQDLGLTLDLMLKLHGVTKKDCGAPVDGEPNGNDLDEVWRKALEEPEVTQRLYDHFKPKARDRGIKEAQEARFRATDFGLTLSSPTIPDDDWVAKRYRRWGTFLTGGWLEEWTANCVRSCFEPPVPEIQVSINCERSFPTRSGFEIDVALVRGHRLYVISCTTEQKKALCKLKLFEVALRSRHMGGDLTRSALVCLLNDGGDKSRTFVEQLQSDIADIWNAPNVPKVFGLAQLREWAGIRGTPSTQTLREWLET